MHNGFLEKVFYFFTFHNCSFSLRFSHCCFSPLSVRLYGSLYVQDKVNGESLKRLEETKEAIEYFGEWAIGFVSFSLSIRSYRILLKFSFGDGYFCSFHLIFSLDLLTWFSAKLALFIGLLLFFVDYRKYAQTLQCYNTLYLFFAALFFSSKLEIISFKQ